MEVSGYVGSQFIDYKLWLVAITDIYYSMFDIVSVVAVVND